MNWRCGYCLDDALAREFWRLQKMEMEADKALDSRGRRSPVDRQIIEGQKALIRRIEKALTGDKTP